MKTVCLEQIYQLSFERFSRKFQFPTGFYQNSIQHDQTVVNLSRGMIPQMMWARPITLFSMGFLLGVFSRKYKLSYYYQVWYMPEKKKKDQEFVATEEYSIQRNIYINNYLIDSTLALFMGFILKLHLIYLFTYSTHLLTVGFRSSFSKA